MVQHCEWLLSLLFVIVVQVEPMTEQIQLNWIELSVEPTASFRQWALYCMVKHCHWVIRHSHTAWSMGGFSHSRVSLLSLWAFYILTLSPFTSPSPLLLHSLPPSSLLLLLPPLPLLCRRCRRPLPATRPWCCLWTWAASSRVRAQGGCRRLCGPWTRAGRMPAPTWRTGRAACAWHSCAARWESRDSLH